MAGSYTRLPSGSWRARVDVDGFTVRGTFPTKRRAEQWVGEQLNKKMYMKPMYVAEDVLLVFEDKKGKLTEKTADELIEFYKENN